MKISTKGRYALRVMIDLAMHREEGFIPLHAIAKRQDITVKYLEQIISLLSRAGFLQSVRGKSGGYRLVREPGEYTVGEILRATEGKLAPTLCLELGPELCQRRQLHGDCPARAFWSEFYDLINDFLDHKTLQDLLPSGEPDP
ncbi:MAG TPA: RrF2 family transcriptional regulator [Candidatus Flavonifractor intestinipullorum]|uniref:RrF2 family transcriptional regulator n=1 Tax=Candidatus Flavonifractor intestinipullorum TaxID=2838587 RepID=A0A9D2MAE5_9FIRM|nr:RrF2 family transcriptional regulator [Candidatus Flavonifractor intestinipullorum]